MIVFEHPADEAKVSAWTRRVLDDLMRASGNPDAKITSVCREPRDQSRIMYENIQRLGLSSQYSLYGPVGDQVLDTYIARKRAGDTPDQIKSAMTTKIIEVGPEKVSHHCADPALLNVVDVSKKSLAKPKEFAAAASKDKRVSKIIDEPINGAVHVEVPQL